MNGIICAPNDDESTLINLALSASDIQCHQVENINNIMTTWSTQPADLLLIILVGSPEETLLEIQSLRSIIIAPIILITDPLPENELIRFYKAGIDLILLRPYSMRMLPYQIKPFLLRNNSIPMLGLPSLIHPSIRLDTHSHSVAIDESAPIHLTQLEFRLLYTLMVHQGEILSAEELVNMVWGYSGEENRDLARGLVQRLRAKIESNPQEPRFIITEPGQGYVFNSH